MINHDSNKNSWESTQTNNEHSEREKRSGLKIYIALDSRVSFVIHMQRSSSDFYYEHQNGGVQREMKPEP